MKIGGFGRFQLVEMVVFSLLRSYGQLVVYLYAQNTEPMPFLCRTEAGASLKECSTEFICEMRRNKLDGLEYVPDQSSVKYLNSWYLQNDLMC